MSEKILLIAGDPNSVNSEIIFKSWKNLDKKIKKKLFIVGSQKLLKTQFKKLGYKVAVEVKKDINHFKNLKNFKIIDVPLNFRNPFNVPLKASSEYTIKSLNIGHDLAIKKNIKGFVNCPINKKLLIKTKKVGVTEYLASKCKILKNNEQMLIYNKKLSVAPITTHINIKDISKKINSNLIIKKTLCLNNGFRKIFGVKPNIGILGLNPHNSEFSKDSEEVKYILPAIKRLKTRGIKISGPFVADTLFINNYKKFDVIIGMYHDQVLAPFKTLFQYDAFNLTLGLNYIRVSPDHGTAKDLIGKNKANSLSLIQCIKFLNNLKK